VIYYSHSLGVLQQRLVDHLRDIFENLSALVSDGTVPALLLSLASVWAPEPCGRRRIKEYFRKRNKDRTV